MTAATAPLIEPITLPDGPKRRGRPPKLGPDGARLNAPRASKPKRSYKRSQAPRSSGSRSLERDIAAFLTMVNGIVLMTPIGTKPMSASPMLGAAAQNEPEKLGDELDAAEIKLLAGAIDSQCRRSPRFRRYVERVLGVGAGGQLVTIVGMIAARRASRHGVIPAFVDPAIGILMEQGDLETIRGMMTPTPVPDADTGEMPPRMGDDLDSLGTFAESIVTLPITMEGGTYDASREGA